MSAEEEAACRPKAIGVGAFQFGSSAHISDLECILGDIAERAKATAQKTSVDVATSEAILGPLHEVVVNMGCLPNSEGVLQVQRRERSSSGYQIQLMQQQQFTFTQMLTQRQLAQQEAMRVQFEQFMQLARRGCQGLASGSDAAPPEGTTAAASHGHHRGAGNSELGQTTQSCTQAGDWCRERAQDQKKANDERCGRIEAEHAIGEDRIAAKRKAKADVGSGDQVVGQQSGSGRQRKGRNSHATSLASESRVEGTQETDHGHCRGDCGENGSGEGGSQSLLLLRRRRRQPPAQLSMQWELQL